MPSTFDLAGVLDLGRQILGLTWEWLRGKAVKLIGEQNVERLEFEEHRERYARLVEGWFGDLPPTARRGDTRGRTACGLQGHVHRHSRVARPLPGGRPLR